jgi:purine-binding chemotaxis protein CheW
MVAASATSARGLYVVFHVAAQSYSLPVASVQEIVPMAELSQVPGSPAFLRGFLNMDGKLVGVVSVRRLLSVDDRDPALYTPLVILKSSSQPIALEVDQVSQIVDLTDETLLPLADNAAFNGCATAVARLDGSSVLVLSPERILLDQEQRRVAELANVERQRLLALEMVTA